MDRFFFYLLGAMAAILIAAIAVVTYSRSPVAAEGTPSAGKAESSPTPDPTPMAKAWTPDSPAEVPMATPAIPMEAATAMPTPISSGPPNYGKTTDVVYPGFTAVYSQSLGSPLAVQYAMVQGAKPKVYPQVKRVATPSPNLIPAAGYARGPMALPKSISMYFGKAAAVNTGLMTNVCAFDPATLAGPWTQLAEMEIRYASEFKWIEIVAGPIFSNPPTKIGGAIIPTAFYRVYRRTYGDTIAFIVPQGATSTKMEGYVTTISAVEAATGVAIFANTVSAEAREAKAEIVW